MIEHIVGMDVSLELSSLCVVNVSGDIMREVMAVSEPDAIVAVLHGLKLQPAYVGLETGLLSQCILNGLNKAGFQTLLLNERSAAETAPNSKNVNSRQNARNVARLLYKHLFAFNC